MTGDGHLDEQPLAAGTRFAFRHACHLGPDLFMLRRRPVGGPLFPGQFIDHLVGRAAKAVDGIHRPHVGHLLLVGFFSFAATRIRAARALPAGGAWAPPCRRRWPPGFRLPRPGVGGMLQPEGFGVLGHPLVHLLGRSLAGRQPQQRAQRSRRFVKRLFHAQPLQPVFQHIGELAGRQSQAFVEGARSICCFSRSA